MTDSNAIFENYVISEIYKSFTNLGKLPPLYYYRDANNRKEIDLLIDRNGILSPIEIKINASPGRKASKHFGAIAPIIGDGKTIGIDNVICNSNELFPLDEETWAVPHWLI